MSNQTHKECSFDKSMEFAPSPKGEHKPKTDKYNWSDIGPQCVYREINKEELRIDERYQREPISQAKVLKIAREFNWPNFGALSVAERTDGTLWVWDGGHRLRAAWKRVDVKKVPCMVSKAINIKDEAKSFYDKNTTVSNVSAYHRLRALNVAEDQLATNTMFILDYYGYHATQDSKTKAGITAVGSLMKIVADDFELSHKVFGLCAEICCFEEQPSKELITPLYWLVKRSKIVGADISDQGIYRSSLIKAGKKAIEELIKREKLIQNKGGDAVSAKAIIDYLNKGKRNKLNLPTQ